MFRVLRIAALFFAAFLASCSGADSGDSTGEPVESPQPVIITDTNPAGDDPENLPRFDIKDVNQLKPYRPDSPYAAVLRDCALAPSVTDACTLETLPFITQSSPGFNREDILDRLLVSHDWMGQRFEQLLAEAPEDLITLFGSLTAISIGSTVRPSFYTTRTGAIQLDPGYLWLSTDEKANISIAEDFRSGYGAELQYWTFGALLQNGQLVSRWYSLTNRDERTLEDIRFPLYRLLYHELAHAVDYLPSASMPTLDQSLSPHEAVYSNEQYALSPRLYDDLALYSEVMFELAQVSFQGIGANELQKTYEPDYVGGEMANDGAMSYYAYNTRREDFATLFATTMMKLHFNMDYYIAFVDKPADEDNYSCAELIVGWGERNRLANPLVAPRARWVVESVYGAGSELLNSFKENVGHTQAMTPGIDWCTNRDSGMIQALAGLSRTKERKLLSHTDSMQQLNADRIGHKH